jgi:hypothetical protein
MFFAVFQIMPARSVQDWWNIGFALVRNGNFRGNINGRYAMEKWTEQQEGISEVGKSGANQVER